MNSQNNQCNALLTCVGRKSFFAKLIEKSERAGTITGADSDPLAAAKVQCTNFRSVSAIGDAYVADLERLSDELKLHCVIALNDLDLEILAQHRDRFAARNVRVMGATVDLVRTFADKISACHWLTKQGFHTPATARAAEAQALIAAHGFPLIAKDRAGQGSAGLKRCQREDDLKTLSAQAIVQPFIQGQEYNLDILRCPTNGVVAVLPKLKLLMYQGLTDKALVVEAPELIELGVRLGNAIGHWGSVDVDVMVDQQGRPYVLDINPRLGGGFPTTAIACPEYVDALLTIGMGRAVAPFLGKYRRNVRVFRDMVYFEVP